MAVTLTTEMINSAIKTQEKYNVPASVTLAQIMLESGGSYPGGLSGLAYNDNNLFGIKAGPNWKGKTVSYNTKEYQNGKYVNTKATFRKYDSIAESIDDHGKLLSSSTYTSKTAGASNLNEYVKAMGGVYATSPTYADNLLSIINQYNLTQYDNGKFPSYNVNGQSYNFYNPFSGSSGSSGSSSGNTSSYSFFNTSGFNVMDNVLTNIVKIFVVVIIIILGIVFLMKAFNVDIGKTVTKVGQKAVKKKTGIDVAKISDATEVVTSDE